MLSTRLFRIPSFSRTVPLLRFSRESTGYLVLAIASCKGWTHFFYHHSCKLEAGPAQTLKGQSLLSNIIPRTTSTQPDPEHSFCFQGRLAFQPLAMGVSLQQDLCLPCMKGRGQIWSTFTKPLHVHVHKCYGAQEHRTNPYTSVEPQ